MYIDQYGHFVEKNTMYPTKKQVVFFKKNAHNQQILAVPHRRNL